jgi:flagellar protein FliO/FliZ
MRCSFTTAFSVCTCALLNALTSTAVFAQEVAQPVKFADPDKVTALPTSGVASMGQVTLALVIVLAVLFAAAWGMRRFKLFTGNGQTTLQVVQGINLGPKERAVLITVQGRKLLLGVAPGCVNLLLELPADVNDESITSTPTDVTPGNAPAAPDFKTLLKRSMGLS